MTPTELNMGESPGYYSTLKKLGIRTNAPNRSIYMTLKSRQKQSIEERSQGGEGAVFGSVGRGAVQGSIVGALS